MSPRKNPLFRILFLRLFLLGMVILSGTGISAAQIAPDPLLEILARSPSALMGDKGMFSYLNFRALEEAQKYVRPLTWSTFSEGKPDADWRTMMMRVRAGGEFLTYAAVLGPAMPTTVGFDWFDIQQAAEIGTPPMVGMLFGGIFGPDAMDKALKSRGFEAQAREGITVWHRFEDNKLSVKDREPGDPFGGNLGISARIGYFPLHIANGRSWAVFDAFLGVYQDTAESMLRHPSYGLIAKVLTDPEVYAQPVIQLIILPQSWLARLPNQQPTGEGEKAPPYLYAGLADRQEGDLQRHELILVYQTAAEANTAAPIIEDRLKEISGMVDAGVSIEFLPPRIAAGENGTAVLILSVRYPWVQEVSAGDPLKRQPGLLFSVWVNRVYRAEFPPLMR